MVSRTGEKAGAWKAPEWATRELKFERLAAQLRRGITDGTWPPGAKLPTVAELEIETGLSLTTIRRAYDLLESSGMIYRRQGSGTFVSPSIQRALTGLTVGVLVPDTTLYVPRVLDGIQEVVAAAGVRLMLASSQNRADTDIEALRDLIDVGVDGLLYVPLIGSGVTAAEHIDRLERIPIPTVLIERRLPVSGPSDDFFHVRTDHEGGAYDAVKHFHKLGHERMALALRGTDGPAADQIEQGFRIAAKHFEATPHIARAPGPEWGIDKADAILAEFQAAGITAVLCYGDREAILILGAARRAGLRVPDDLAIISYDNEMADVAEVPLTALSPPKFLLGKLAAEYLLRRLSGNDEVPPHQTALRPPLVIRASCGATQSTRRVPRQIWNR